MTNKSLRIKLPILCILWICFIFFMSSDVNSSERSITISETISQEVHGTAVTDEESLDQLDFLIRKGSHFLEYMVLSLLLLKTGEVYGLKLKQSAGYVLFACLLIANLDELYQSFVPGRNSLVMDSLIDCGGAIMGLLGYAGIIKISSGVTPKF